MKRRIGLILLFLAVLCCTAALSETEGDFEYVILEDGTAKITYWNGDESNPFITVPDMVNGFMVTAIDDYVFDISKFRVEVVLPDNISYVGKRAFGFGTKSAAKAVYCSMNSLTAKTVSASDYGKGFHPIDKPEIALKWNADESLTLTDADEGLTTLEIPDGVTVIFAQVFQGYESLQTLILPDSITKICYKAFDGCPNLTITLPDNIQVLEDHWNGSSIHPKEIICTPGSATAKLLDADGIAYTAPVKTGVTIRWVGSILTLTDVEPDQTEVTVPEGVTAIKAEAFRRAEALRHVKLPSTLETVEPGVRDTLDGFDSIRVPDGAAVEAEAFWGVGTNRVVIPEGVTALDSAAFAGCPNLLLVELPSTLTDIPDNLLDGSPFAKVTAPAGSEAWNWAEAKGILAD